MFQPSDSKQWVDEGCSSQMSYERQTILVFDESYKEGKWEALWFL